MHRDRAAGARRKKKTTNLIFMGVIAAVAVAIGVSAYSYVQNPPRTASFGAVGSTHDHATFLLFIHSETVDFDQPKYSGKSGYMHLHPGEGALIHKHATGVDLGFFFESMDISFTNECLTMDDGTEYCNNGTNTLKFFLNGAANSMYEKYVFKDGDRILISYGAEGQERINEQLKEVDEIVFEITD